MGRRRTSTVDASPPRWVKVLGMIIGVLVLVVVLLLLLTDGHGPGRHTLSARYVHTPQSGFDGRQP